MKSPGNRGVWFDGIISPTGVQTPFEEVRLELSQEGVTGMVTVHPEGQLCVFVTIATVATVTTVATRSHHSPWLTLEVWVNV